VIFVDPILKAIWKKRSLITTDAFDYSLTLPPPIDEDDSTSKPGFYTASAQS
jgi:hypothetical protein